MRRLISGSGESIPLSESVVTSAATKKLKGLPRKRSGEAFAITTKNKHRCRVFAVQPQVFRGGRFGVWGTPPPKPLNCKVWENPAGAFASAASYSEALCFPNPNSFVWPFVRYFQAIKNPAYFAVSRVCRKSLLLFTCLPPVCPN